MKKNNAPQITSTEDVNVINQTAEVSQPTDIAQVEANASSAEDAKREKVVSVCKKTWSAAKKIGVAACCFLVTAAAVVTGIFSYSAVAAKTNTYETSATAREIAIEYVNANYRQGNETVLIKDIDRNFSVGNKLNNSKYFYEVEVQLGRNTEIDLLIDGASGEVTVRDIDVD